MNALLATSSTNSVEERESNLILPRHRGGADVADAMRIQYGGSANDKNCHDLAAGEDVDGFLVGGACLAADSFGVILATFD